MKLKSSFFIICLMYCAFLATGCKSISSMVQPSIHFTDPTLQAAYTGSPLHQSTSKTATKQEFGSSFVNITGDGKSILLTGAESIFQGKTFVGEVVDDTHAKITGVLAQTSSDTTRYKVLEGEMCINNHKHLLITCTPIKYTDTTADGETTHVVSGSFKQMTM